MVHRKRIGEAAVDSESTASTLLVMRWILFYCGTSVYHIAGLKFVAQSNYIRY